MACFAVSKGLLPSLPDFVVDETAERIASFLQSLAIPCNTLSRGSARRAASRNSEHRKNRTSKEAQTVPKKKQSSEGPPIQIVFRVGKTMHDALLTAAAGLGVDLSNLLRMMIAEKIPEYIERGRRAAAALEQATRKVQGSPNAEESTKEGTRQARTSARPDRRTIDLGPSKERRGQ
jgi:hypothetical protein